MQVVTPFTLVMPYYENPRMLGCHYHMWQSWDPVTLGGMNVIVVDDGSPRSPACVPNPRCADAEIPAIPGLALQIYRMGVDIRWNQDACRNVGVAHAETNWVLLTDIDHMVSEDVCRYLLTRRWDESSAYKFKRVSLPDLAPYKPHPNSWFMSRKLYDRAGGYDERFAGYYGTDGDFRDRVVRQANEVMTLKQSLIRVPREEVPDASTTHYLRKQPEDRAGLARVYEERKQIDNWVPLRGSFPYERVFPK